jgi:CheY-like chemotaxis protein
LVSENSTRSLRVLVVDDYPDNAESMEMFLKLHRHDVRTARSGPAALRAARAAPPDVVLLDISMPGMSGYDIAGNLREMFHDKVMLIAITGRQSDEDQAHALEAGFDHYFVKPADPDAVESVLEELAGALSAGCSGQRFSGPDQSSDPL